MAIGGSLSNSTIESAFEIGHRAHPTVELQLAAFTEFARARAETWNGNLERAADLYLACACVARLPAAATEFLARFADRIPRYLGRLARNADLVAEVRQIVVTRCIVADGDGPPALEGYSATGSLEGWVRATAVREAIALNRHRDRHTGNVERALEAQMPWVDREISLFKQIYREPVSRAFAAACRQLDANDRALLRLHYVEGVTTARLANIYGISRATLVRRLATARESLVDGVKAVLRADAGITNQDFDSVLRLVKSQIDLRLSLVLKQPA